MAVKSPLSSACAGLCLNYLREVQKALGADLTQFNGEDSWTLPMPARYVIAQDGADRLRRGERRLHPAARTFGHLPGSGATGPPAGRLIPCLPSQPG